MDNNLCTDEAKHIMIITINNCVNNITDRLISNSVKREESNDI